MNITFKTLRQKNNLKCSEIAISLGITESAYRKYERSARIPQAKTLIKLQKTLNCSDEELLKALNYHTCRKTRE